jgi:uncharacterized membrane protein YhhN|tara:strand:- start:97 stop:774 length:678 start_codon:yes stop_codon:yes gene_type:complete
MDNSKQSGSLGKALLLLSVLFAIAFWVSIYFQPVPGSPVLKWFPVGLLSLYMFLGPKSKQRWALALGLFFHSVGDVILDFKQENLFLVAVGGFLIGHLCYIVMLLPDVRRGVEWTKGKVGFLLGILGYAVLIGWILLPKLAPGMIPPLAVYMVAIAAMVVLTVLPGYRGKWITVGALLYMGSDTLIAYNQFVSHVPGSHYITWPAYYGGQALIMIGFLREKSLSS